MPLVFVLLLTFLVKLNGLKCLWVGSKEMGMEDFWSCQSFLAAALTFPTRCNYVLYLSLFGLRLLTKQVLSQLSFWTPVFLMWQSVPEVDPAANMHNSQSQQRMSSSSYSSSSPTAYSAPQAPALNVTGPITANSEQVLACWFFWVGLFQQIKLEINLQRNFYFNPLDFVS